MSILEESVLPDVEEVSLEDVELPEIVEAEAEADVPVEHQLSDTQFQSLVNAIIVRQQNEQSLQNATAREKEIIALICDALKIDGEKAYQIDQQRKMLIG